MTTAKTQVVPALSGSSTASGASHEAVDCLGLFQVWPDPELDSSCTIETNVDVIAVHGLGGHPFNTWTDGGKFWLRDFLSDDLPKARVLTFGYNSAMAFTTPSSKLRDSATMLLECVKQHRRLKARDGRKTLFVCHSLGGILFKQALVIAHERQLRFKDILDTVDGVVFLGTPHRGYDPNFWVTLLTRLANFAVAGRTRDNLLDNIIPKPRELGDICVQFIERASKLHIFSLYERHATAEIETLVVDDSSAIMHLPNETPIPIEADHRGMCKFLTSADNNYRTVSECIIELVDLLVEEAVFQYRHLDNVNYEIRILTILAESASQDIRATLEHISLIDADAYTALSYCWGNPKITAPIYIDDVRVEVTLNLKAALLQLRSRGYGRVWIDAVCINQADEDERSLQVRNMRQIFSRADQVICWVGESSPEAAEAAHKEFQKAPRVHQRGRCYPSITKLFVPILLVTDEQRHRSKERSPNLDVLVDFFSRPYWNRAWIIQEVAVAANVKILFGNVEMRWSTMLPLLEWLEGKEQLEPLRSHLDGALTLSGFRHKLSVSPQSVSLYQALQRSSKSLATDERDRIFALLGVSHDGPALVPLPNYKQSLERILSDMTVAMIRQSRSLDIIFLRRVNLVPDESWPSWVPDWLHLWDQGRQVPFLEATYEHWKQSYSYSRNPLARRIDQGKIAVRGVLFDIVSTLSTRISSNDREHSQNSSTETGTQDTTQIHPQNRANSNVMWQTICMIQSKLDVASESELEKRGHLLFTKLISLETVSGSQSGDPTSNAALRQWLRENMSTVFGDYRLQDWVRGSLSSNIKIPRLNIQIPLYFESLQSFIERVETILNSGMRLMSTSEGWLGMAHPNARVGDRIAYVQGCSVPVTLRETTAPEDVKPAFAVVGGAYLHWSHKNYGAYRQFVETGLWEEMDKVEELILS